MLDASWGRSSAAALALQSPFRLPYSHPCQAGSTLLGMCPAPVLSVIRRDTHRDVLVPPFVPAYEPQWVPWDEKKDQAFFRCGALCNVLCCAQ